MDDRWTDDHLRWCAQGSHASRRFSVQRNWRGRWRRSSVPVADYLRGESDTDNTCLIESGNPLTGLSPDVWYQPVTHPLEIFLVAFQIACQQLLLAKDAHHEQPEHGEAYEKAGNGAEQQRATNEH